MPEYEHMPDEVLERVRGEAQTVVRKVNEELSRRVVTRCALTVGDLIRRGGRECVVREVVGLPWGVVSVRVSRRTMTGRWSTRTVTVQERCDGFKKVGHVDLAS